ncbi:MAG: ribosomal protection-like ABC-F family protein [Blautia sp.]|uniref:ribosomal protection-like ABC-F family protein n=1 Tax=unclassified Blautia TaxID=2648079 RepID=UPI001FD23CF9|nr:ABC-F type ribosomal protection protein [Blautia sp. NSJ-175]MCJ7847436.1 ABC-F type ribosomal protection protein [Blautia sp. NSJ-175]
MAKISASGLTFCYDGSYDDIFYEASFIMDTNWKLGLIGRNGKGKTTLLRLLMGQYSYRGSISSSVLFDYFPFQIQKEDMERDTIEVIERIQPDYEQWRICRELELLHVEADILYRPYQTLSHGERTKVMLAVLFSRENYFLLIDEPTNHLDMETRELLCAYLNRKKGFILVSHDRWLLDSCIDHVLALERNQIEVEKGNFTSWWENKQRRDQYEISENEKLKQEIKKMEESARKASAWAEKAENTKIGFNPLKEHDRFLDTRAYIGEKARRMQQRRKNLERRQQTAIREKEQLLKNLEQPAQLRLTPLTHHKETYIRIKDASVSYGSHQVIRNFSMELKRGERILLQGKNGCGKSSILKMILRDAGMRLPREKDFCVQGQHELAAGLEISYINQDTSFLRGSLDAYMERESLDGSLFRAILRKLDFERIQFEKPMEEYSEGQKKKVLIASSLLKPAHLYIWDEPMNYIDIFSRMQIEELILEYEPTMLLVEHDRDFGNRCATQVITI